MGPTTPSTTPPRRAPYGDGGARVSGGGGPARRLLAAPFARHVPNDAVDGLKTGLVFLLFLLFWVSPTGKRYADPCPLAPRARGRGMARTHRGGRGCRRHSTAPTPAPAPAPAPIVETSSSSSSRRASTVLSEFAELVEGRRSNPPSKSTHA